MLFALEVSVSKPNHALGCYSHPGYLSNFISERWSKHLADWHPRAYWNRERRIAGPAWPLPTWLSKRPVSPSKRGISARN